MEQLLNIVLADDDQDDRFFFEKAINTLPFKIQLQMVEDGELLMDYLAKQPLPDIIFLDINMPKINGYECLQKIKSNTVTEKIIIIIYSTSLDEVAIEKVYHSGAHYYFQKVYIKDLTKSLERVLQELITSGYARPEFSRFIVNPKKYF